MNLYINTTNGESIFIAVTENHKILLQKIIKAKYKQSERVLTEIDKLLTKVKDIYNLFSKKQNLISNIVIVNGPGPFTATRIGVTVGNTLAYAWQVPVVGIKNSEFKDNYELINKAEKKLLKVKKNNIVEPFYNQAPSITVSKK